MGPVRLDPIWQQSHNATFDYPVWVYATRIQADLYASERHFIELPEAGVAASGTEVYLLNSECMRMVRVNKHSLNFRLQTEALNKRSTY